MAGLPGLTVEITRPAAGESPLRTDVAGVLGRTRRGPVGTPVRVAGRRDLEARFGGPDTRFGTGYALRGYVENGGQVAHVIRLGGPGGRPASTPWVIGDVVDGGFLHAAYRIEAATAGEWADATRITITYLSSGRTGRPELNVRTEVPGEPPEVLTGIDPAEVVSGVAGSRFVRLVPDGPLPAVVPAGPASAVWREVLGGGVDPVPGVDDYLDAVERLGEVVEVALVLAPDLHPDLGPAAPEVLRALLRDAAVRQDRLVLVDLPAGDSAGPVDRVRDLVGSWADEPHLLRAAAVYHPWVRTADPLGGVRAPLRDVPPCGHVAGLASRLDRQRGAQHTPANALLADAVDLTTPVDRDQQVTLVAQGVNVLRCRPAHGLEVWGGRTLDPDPARRFVTHRRLLHRLVRAIRRVAEPLVFEPDGPVLRFALVRGLYSVLLEAWRAGGLQGATPEQGFRVRCDDANNPPEQTDRGLLQCEILLAPAAPMEFIRILLTVAPEGRLEVVES